MRSIYIKLFAGSLVGAMLLGTCVANAAPTAGLSAYTNYVSTAGKNPTAGFSASVSSYLVSSAQEEMMAGASIAIEDDEKVVVAASGEEEITTSVDSISLGAAITDEYTYLAIAQVDGFVNVRASATTDSDIVGKLYDDNVATVTGVDGDWYKISSGNVTGYVRSDFVSVGNEKLAKSLDSYTYAISKEEEEAKLAEEAAAKKAEAAKSAASYQQWVDTYYGANATGVSGEAVVQYALQFVGYPYVHGGSSLTQGTDCSGFTMLVYQQFGINLPRASDAYYYVGTPVSREQLQPGDIIVYYGHVAIYMGNNACVHASNSRDGIKVTYGIDYREIHSFRRVL